MAQQPLRAPHYPPPLPLATGGPPRPLRALSPVSPPPSARLSGAGAPAGGAAGPFCFLGVGFTAFSPSVFLPSLFASPFSFCFAERARRRLPSLLAAARSTCLPCNGRSAHGRRRVGRRGRPR